MKPLMITVAIIGFLAGISAPVIGLYVPRSLVYVFSAAMIGVALIVVYRIERARRRSIMAKVYHLFEGRAEMSTDEFGTKYFTGQESKIAAALVNRMKPYFPFDLSRVSPEDRFHEDLELRYWDDLADVDLVKWLEKTYRVSFSDDETRGIETIRQLVEATARKMTAQPGVVADGPVCHGLC
jgi:acyl carrier protein